MADIRAYLLCRDNFIALCLEVYKRGLKPNPETQDSPCQLGPAPAELQHAFLNHSAFVEILECSHKSLQHLTYKDLLKPGLHWLSSPANGEGQAFLKSASPHGTHTARVLV